MGILTAAGEGTKERFPLELPDHAGAALPKRKCLSPMLRTKGVRGRTRDTRFTGALTPSFGIPRPAKCFDDIAWRWIVKLGLGRAVELNQIGKPDDAVLNEHSHPGDGWDHMDGFLRLRPGVQLCIKACWEDYNQSARGSPPKEPWGPSRPGHRTALKLNRKPVADDIRVDRLPNPIM